MWKSRGGPRPRAPSPLNVVAYAHAYGNPSPPPKIPSQFAPPPPAPFSECSQDEWWLSKTITTSIDEDIHHR